MRSLLNRWLGLNNWLKAIVFFCLLGCVSNVILICRDLSSTGILLRLHIGFFILYAAQIAFIFLHERMVWIIAVLQGVLALATNADFTFVPLVRVIGRTIYVFTNPTVEFIKVYKYVLISISFTLQMLSAYAEFSLLPISAKKIQSSAEETTAEESIPTENL